MNRMTRTTIVAAAAGLSWLADVAPEPPLRLTLGREAAAIIGMPFTPMSYAGVARRTTRRFAYAEAATTAAVATTAVAASTAAANSAAAAAAAQHQAAAQQQARAANAPAIGTIVPALPGACTATPRGGVEYYNCAGVYYRAAFQGNNLVYVVQQP